MRSAQPLQTPPHFHRTNELAVINLDAYHKVQIVITCGSTKLLLGKWGWIRVGSKLSNPSAGEGVEY
jgi:hypothetical protein